MFGGVEGGQFEVPGGKGAPQPRDLERGPLPMFRIRKAVAGGRSGRRRIQNRPKRRRYLQRPIQCRRRQQNDDPEKRQVRHQTRPCSLSTRFSAAPFPSKCRFPLWIANYNHWHSLDYSLSYNFHHRNSTLRITNSSGLEMKVVCTQTRHATREETSVMLLAHFTMGW